MFINSLILANEALEQKDLQIQELTKKLESTQRSLKMLQNQVEQLLKRLYGRKSEKHDPNQLMFESMMLEVLDQPEQDPPAPWLRRAQQPAPK